MVDVTDETPLGGANEALHTEEESKSKAALEFDAAMNAVPFSPADAAKAVEISRSGRLPSYDLITQGVAAAIFKLHNARVNRTFSVTKCRGFVAAAQRGEWLKNHQGVAFYPDGNLADGQHRIAMIALSGVAVELLVSNDFDKAAINTIDRGGRRSAGETLEMDGKKDGKEMAAIARQTMQYVTEVDHKTKVSPTDSQILAFVHANEPMLNSAIMVGHTSVQNVNDPPLTAKQASLFAFTRMFGGDGQAQVQAFLACVQQGIADYSESPTLELSRRAARAKISEKKRDRLRPRDLLALMLKAVDLWEHEKRVSRLSVDPKQLPDYRVTPVVPVVLPQAAE